MCTKGQNNDFHEHNQWDVRDVRLASSPLSRAAAPYRRPHANWVKTDGQTVIFAL